MLPRGMGLQLFWARARRSSATPHVGGVPSARPSSARRADGAATTHTRPPPRRGSRDAFSRTAQGAAAMAPHICSLLFKPRREDWAAAASAAAGSKWCAQRRASRRRAKRTAAPCCPPRALHAVPMRAPRRERAQLPRRRALAAAACASGCRGARQSRQQRRAHTPFAHSSAVSLTLFAARTLVAAGAGLLWLCAPGAKIKARAAPSTALYKRHPRGCPLRFFAHLRFVPSPGRGVRRLPE